MPKPTRKQQAGWIKRINDEGLNLTSWEQVFMENITDYFERGGILSDRQLEILEKIYANKTS